MKYIAIFLVHWVCSLGNFNICFAQNAKTDSLLRLLALAPENSFEKADLRRAMGLHLSIRNDFMRSENYFQKASEYYLNKASEKQKAFFLLDYGSLGRKQGNYKQANYFYETALKIAQDLQIDKELLAACHHRLGVLRWYQGNYWESESYLQKALDYYEENKDESKKYDLIGAIGTAYESQGQYQKALENYLKACEYFEKTKNKSSLYVYNLNIGNIWRSYQKNEAKALEYYQKSLNISTEIDDRRGQAQSYNNIGLIYEANHQLPKALEYFEKALAINIQLGIKPGQSFNFRNIARMYQAQKNYPKAFEYTQKALKLNREIGEDNREGANLQLTGILFLEQEQYKEAETHFDQAMVIFKKIRRFHDIADTHEWQAKVYHKTGRYKNAYESILLRNNIQDSLMDSERSKQMTQIQIYYDTKEKERMNLLLKKQNDLKDAEIEARSLLEQKIRLEKENREQENNLLMTENDLKETTIKQQRTQELRMLSERRNKEQETLYLKNESLLQMRNIEQKNIALAFAGFVFFLLGIFTLLFYKQKRNQQKLNKDLEKQKNEVFNKNEKIEAQSQQLEAQNNTLSQKNEQIEILVQEIHHRVKNNMQTISSMLNLQSAQIQDAKARETLQEGRNRIKAMSLIYQKLYQQENVSLVDIAEYIEKLTHDLAYTYGYQDIKTIFELDIIELEINKAIPFCMIVNELLSNCFKYAFKDNPNPTLSISLVQSDGILLVVQDNGTGIKDLENIKENGNFGTKLIYSLIKQLRANLKMENKEGLKVTLSL
jgi:two-component system, sensor histidine kinase PdtaS